MLEVWKKCKIKSNNGMILLTNIISFNSVWKCAGPVLVQLTVDRDVPVSNPTMA